MLRDYLDEHASVHVTTAELAKAGHVEVHDLSRVLREDLRLSPAAFIRRHRFDRVHRELLAGDPSMLTVADCARRWGFVHLALFTAAYQARHGEDPERTLLSVRPLTSDGRITSSDDRPALNGE
jgi:AraC-like DNA-binding protein